MTDRTAALAEAIDAAGLTVDMTRWQAGVWAAAIIAKLPPDWCGHEAAAGERERIAAAVEARVKLPATEGRLGYIQVAAVLALLDG